MLIRYHSFLHIIGKAGATVISVCSARLLSMRTCLDPLRSAPRYSKLPSRRTVLQRSSKKPAPFFMLGLLTPWKSHGESCTTSVVEEASHAAKPFEKNLAVLQSSCNVAEEAGKCANSIEVSMESKHETVGQLLADLEKRNLAACEGNVGQDMTVDLFVHPSDVAQTIHDMVAKSRPRGLIAPFIGSPTIGTPTFDLPLDQPTLQEDETISPQPPPVLEPAPLTFIPMSPPDTPRRAEGSGHEIMLQAFNWVSHRGDYYGHICEMAPKFAELGFTCYGDESGLRQAVQALKDNGLKVAGDCVLNHRCALHQNEQGIWNRFGGRLDWDARAICGDDHNFKGMGNPSTGDFFHAAPNVDHTQQFVREGICEWLNWLRCDIGIDGYRLDFARGFSGKFVKEYCERTHPEFVVGEYWDSLSYEHGVATYCQNHHRQQIINWINAAGGQATAFDVTTKGILHEVFHRSEYWRLSDPHRKPPGVIGWWPSRAVTFLENHDTGCAQAHWEFPQHGLEQGYCYILTHAGTPTVFYNHLYDEHRFGSVANAIKSLIAIRKRNHIGARSKVDIADFSDRHYSAIIDDRLAMRIGDDNWSPHGQWSLAASGDRWVVWELK